MAYKLIDAAQARWRGGQRTATGSHSSVPALSSIKANCWSDPPKSPRPNLPAQPRRKSPETRGELYRRNAIRFAATL